MFPCSACGLCCQHIGTVEELKAYDRGNGVCKYYDVSSRQCSIYEERPLICRIDEMYSIQYSKTFTKEDFYRENAKVCNFLQERYKIDKSYRIHIGE